MRITTRRCMAAAVALLLSGCVDRHGAAAGPGPGPVALVNCDGFYDDFYGPFDAMAAGRTTASSGIACATVVITATTMATSVTRRCRGCTRSMESGPAPAFTSANVDGSAACELASTCWMPIRGQSWVPVGSHHLAATCGYRRSRSQQDGARARLGPD
jgi:hypothetical protein